VVSAVAASADSDIASSRVWPAVAAGRMDLAAFVGPAERVQLVTFTSSWHVPKLFEFTGARRPRLLPREERFSAATARRVRRKMRSSPGLVNRATGCEHRTKGARRSVRYACPADRLVILSRGQHDLLTAAVEGDTD